MKLGRRLIIVPVILLILAAGVLAVACGGDDKGSSSSVTVPEGAPVIDQDNLTFKPDKITIEVNQKMYFLNSESAIHTVTIEGKNISGNMKKGDVVVWSTSKAGEYKVTCDYHPQMKATITVK